MRALLLHPGFPETFWSFGPILDLIGKKALNPPLGLITVAALLPDDWDLTLVDCALRPPREDEWEAADIVLLTGMIVQQDQMMDLIAEAHRRGLPVAVGGPYATSVPEDFEAADVDYLVLDEGEISIPPFVAHLAEHGPRRKPAGAPAERFTAKGKKPEVTATPVPRFDLLERDKYDSMSIQYSRGCPFLCEFCDIITLYGRKPRTKTNEQVFAELQALYDLGWRGGVFFVDDNFIGNKPNVKKLLPELQVWQERHGMPFWFDTEASIDLAADPEMVAAMVRCNFGTVFIGIETPDEDSLHLTKKQQNTRAPMLESIDMLNRSGLRIMCGMIIGFDGEKPGAGQRIVDFSEAAGIPTVLLSMLQVLPNTGLYTRLQKEGRLHDRKAGLKQNDVLNFEPTRPLPEIVREYADAIEALYDPEAYLERTYRHFMTLGIDKPARAAPPAPADMVQRRSPVQVLKAGIGDLRMVRALLIVAWRQGVVRKSRRVFWKRLREIRRARPELWTTYVAICAHGEHFIPLSQRTAAEVRARCAEIEAGAPVGMQPLPTPRAEAVPS